MRQPFAIVEIESGTYACPGWFPIKKDVNVKDLVSMDFGVPKEIIAKVKAPAIKSKIEKLVLGSNGKDYYTVKFNGINWSCTCKGYGFRRTCRHIKEIKQNINL